MLTIVGKQSRDKLEIWASALSSSAVEAAAAASAVVGACTLIVGRLIAGARGVKILPRRVGFGGSLEEEQNNLERWWSGTGFLRALLTSIFDSRDMCTLLPSNADVRPGWRGWVSSHVEAQDNLEQQTDSHCQRRHQSRWRHWR